MRGSSHTVSRETISIDSCSFGTLVLHTRLIHYSHHSFVLLFVAIARAVHFIYVSREPSILRFMNHFGPTDAHRAAERPAALLLSDFFLTGIISY